MSQILGNSSGIKVSHVSIEKFRRFENIDFEIGPQLTIIAGQNGTCKSTLLALLSGKNSAEKISEKIGLIG